MRRHWPARLGSPPREMVTGVPAHVDGRMLDISEKAGVRLVNRDRMWHYTEGLGNWDPIWPGHGIRILPGPSALWFDALGRRLPAPCLPGYDTLATLRHLRTTEDLAEHDHSWFLLTRKIIEKEFALSGSEQNPDITAKDRAAFLRTRVFGKGIPGPVDAFVRDGADFVTAPDLEQLVARMNALTGRELLDPAVIRHQVEARDLQIAHAYSKDAQVQGIRNARRYLGDRLSRVAAPHRILDPAAGPSSASGCASSPANPSAASRPTSTPARSAPTARWWTACTRPARSPASAAEACTVTAPSRAPSSAVASSPAAWRAGRWRGSLAEARHAPD